MITADDVQALAYIKHVEYIAMARKAKATGDLRVGIKLVRPDLTSYAGYRWPVPMPGEVIKVQCENWQDDNESSCPRIPGDGLCWATSANHLTSGTVRSIAEAVGLVVVSNQSQTDTKGKFRSPVLWVVDVFAPLEMARSQMWVGANLYGANLYGVVLYGANLSGADLYGAHNVNKTGALNAAD